MASSSLQRLQCELQWEAQNCRGGDRKDSMFWYVWLAACLGWDVGDFSAVRVCVLLSCLSFDHTCNGCVIMHTTSCMPHYTNIVHPSPLPQKFLGNSRLKAFDCPQFVGAYKLMCGDLCDHRLWQQLTFFELCPFLEECIAICFPTPYLHLVCLFWRMRRDYWWLSRRERWKRTGRH